MPFYLAICFAFHPYIGLTALVGAIVLVALTLVTEVMMRRPGKDVADHARNRKPARGSKPAQCRGDPRHGHERAPRPSAGRRPTSNT